MVLVVVVTVLIIALGVLRVLVLRVLMTELEGALKALKLLVAAGEGQGAGGA
jgi:hypothetical protein